MRLLEPILLGETHENLALKKDQTVIALLSYSLNTPITITDDDEKGQT